MFFSEKAPPSHNYVPGPEHPPSLDYVSGPKYPEYVAPSDDEIPVEGQPLPADASPTALSSSYVTDFDLEEDLEEDPADYPIARGDDDDEEEEEAFEEDEEEEHLAPADSSAPTPSPPRSP
nr:hypothetical protein [Tanacetum cinerariifolium]